MTNRVDLIAALADTDPKLTIAHTKALEKALNKAYITLLFSCDLERARRLPANVREGIADTMAYIPTMTELKKVSKAWDPKRGVGKTCSHPALVEDLVTLMNGEREPYVIPKMTLAAAQKLSGMERSDLDLAIESLATPAQIKALLKKWDKHNKAALTWAEAKQRTHCQALLSQTVSPQDAPPKAPRARKS